jgi:hypothetical protein
MREGKDGGERHPLLGRWAPNLTLHVESGRTCVAELMCGGRGVLIDLAGRSKLHGVARKWADRVDVISARCYERPANLDAMLIRPDGYVAWVLKSGDEDDESGGTLRAGFQKWFGKARKIRDEARPSRLISECKVRRKPEATPLRRGCRPLS